MNGRTFLFFLLMGLLNFTYARENQRQQLFLMEKTYNEENIMVIHGQVDEECHFVGDDLIDYYWLMDGKKEKRVHPLIKSGIKKRIQFADLAENKKSFNIKMNDLNEVKHDLEDINIHVSSEKKDGVCKVQTVLKLGPSKDHKDLVLERTFCEVKKNLVRIPVGCKKLELIGKDLKNGEELRVTFLAR